MAAEKTRDNIGSPTSDGSQQIKVLDEAFKSYIDDMKPFVLSLSQKRDRQRIALWIKKLCGPMGLKPIERKNRNLYAQILFQMLRKGTIEEPFSEDPTSGPLQILPAYPTRYFDESTSLNKAKQKEKIQRAPEWIRGELPSTDSAFSELRYQRSGTGSEPDSPASPAYSKRSMVFKYTGNHDLPDVDDATRNEESDPYLSDDSHDADSLDESVDYEGAQSYSNKNVRITPPPSPVRGRLGEIYMKKQIPKKTEIGEEDHRNFRRRGTSISPENGLNSSANEKETMKASIHELQGKITSLEARLAQEKVMLHKEKDMAVQKVLDRKNTEIEGIKSHFRNKLNEGEETRRRQEKKIVKLTRDLTNAINRNDNEVQELQAIIQQNKTNAEHELDRRVHDKIAEFEEEKFAMQKQHSQNIQELLDETNERLKKIESEYLQKIESADSQVKDLEHEMYQLKRSRDIHKQEKEELFAEKGELKERLAKSYKEQKHMESRIKEIEKEKNDIIEKHDKVLRDLRRKTESTMESMMKENTNATSKASGVISELEGKINQYKQSLEDLELQRKRDLREHESNHKQEIVRLEVNQEKMIRKQKIDAEKMEMELQNKLKIAEQAIKEKDVRITQLTAEISDQNLQAQTAIENFKKQAEENSKKIFQEMKQQIHKVEDDLTKAYRENSDQKAKHTEEINSLMQKYEKQIANLKDLHAQEKEQLLKDTEAELETQAKEYKETLEDTKSKFIKRISELEDALRVERDSASKKLSENDQTIRELRDEVIQANSLRKQQLVELGMLRDEEKQTFKRQEESLQAKFKSQLEQLKCDLQNEHSTAMQEILEKTNAKVKEIEHEYTLSLEKSQQTITELQSQVMEVNEKLSREQSHAQVKILDLTEKYENQKEELKRHHSYTTKGLHHDIELYRTKSKDLERKCCNLELQSQESLTKLKLEYEEKVRGLLPNSARMELEETITALREQIALLQSRASLLQQELDSREDLSSSFNGHGPQLTSSR